jgi:AhpD family alkylhydroperoxidase
MTRVEVFDPAMCCSTGVCGPSVDPALAVFAADLQWVGEQGAGVTRYNLAQQPGPFAERAEIRTLLAERGDEALPVVVVDGQVRSSGRYPARAELASWALPGGAAEALDEVTAELVAIGAAVGANCEPCLKYHYAKARKAGAGAGAITAAVRLAQAVKDAPARSVLELAARLLGTSPQDLAPAPAGQPERGGAGQDQPAAAAAGTATVTTEAAAGEAAAAEGGCCGGPAAELTLPQAPQADAAQPLAPCCGGQEADGDASLAVAAAGEGGCCG